MTRSASAGLVDAVRGGDRGALARLLSIVETGGDDARAAMTALPVSAADSAWTIGVTGAPGAGKSTLTAALVRHLRAAGARIGVLAVDPSSPFTGGAILGDRVRMHDHTTDPDVFIRSMATRGHLGGLARAVPQAIRVLAAAGLRVDRGGDGRRGAGGGGDRGHRRHHRRGRQPGLGRRRAGGQGGSARDRRRVRGEQGRSRRCRGDRPRPPGDARAGRSRATGAPRCSRPSPPTTGASTRSSTRSAAIGARSRRRATSPHAANSA